MSMSFVNIHSNRNNDLSLLLRPVYKLSVLLHSLSMMYELTEYDKLYVDWFSKQIFGWF